VGPITHGIGTTETTGRGVELARQFIDAFNARDVDGVRALVTDDVQFRNRRGKSFVGLDGVRDVVRAAADARLTLVRDGEPRTDDHGARVYLPVRVQLGRDEMHETAVFDVRDGRIAGFEAIPGD
jgi:ketosteroid isomerase-like protein